MDFESYRREIVMSAREQYPQMDELAEQRAFEQAEEQR